MDFALTVAGSDSSSGAGIQADIKTFLKIKVPCLSVITAITAQNSKGVYSIFPVPVKEIEKQLKVLENDFKIKVAKVGMVPDIKSIEIISKFFKRRRDIFFLLDPVLISTSGFNLFLEDTKDALRKKLIPLCNILTPNLDEARSLLNIGEKDDPGILEEIFNKFKVPVLLKGGHRKGKYIEDIFFDGKEKRKYKFKRIEGEFHGTGCILSSAIISYIYKGLEIKEGIRKAEIFLHKLMVNPYNKNKKIKYII